MAKCNEYNSSQHDYSFNFWLGCKKFSEGCQNCYMFVAQSSIPWGRPAEVRRCKPSTWKNPITWQRKAAKAGELKSVFACSYSDFFMEEADEWRDDAWSLIRATPNLIWRLTSKRTHLMADRLPKDWGSGYPNVWLGTTVELKKYMYRLDQLRQIPCVLRWAELSHVLEDLLPELADHIDGIGWVNASGETGCNRIDPRPFDLQWGRNIRDMCKEKGIPFRFSHAGGRERYPNRHLDGVVYNELPPLGSYLVTDGTTRQVGAR
jgi:protein gp37